MRQIKFSEDWTLKQYKTEANAIKQFTKWCEKNIQDEARQEIQFLTQYHESGKWSILVILSYNTVAIHWLTEIACAGFKVVAR